jgi:ArsR family transcriptional regulator
MDDQSGQMTAALLAALGSEYRLRMVELLADGERCVCEIAPYFPTAFSVVSHHLAVLERAGVVESRRDGRWMRYRLADESITALLETARRLAGRRGSSRRTARRPKASDRECCPLPKVRKPDVGRER